jgi:aminotransferase
MEIADWIGEVEKEMALGFEEAFRQIDKGSKDYLQFLVADEGVVAFKASEHIREAGKQAIDEHRYVYTSFEGLFEVRTAIAGKLEKFNKIEVDPETEICLTDGTSQGIFMAALSLIEPGDDVLIMDPDYMGYFGPVRIAGGKDIHVPCRYDEKDNQFKFDSEKVMEAITDKTKMIMFSNPCNPTGYVYSRNDLAAIAKLAKEHDCYVFADELYEKLIYDGREHVSMMTLPGMKERTLTVMGTSKTESMQIFRVGYIIGPKEVMKPIKKLVSLSTLRVPYVSQKAFLAFITEKDDKFRKDRVKRHQECRDHIAEGLNEIEGIKCNVPMGTSYVFPNHEEIEPSSAKFCLALAKSGKMFTEPGFEFGPNSEGHQRLCFSQSKDKLDEGIKRVKRVVKEIRGR